MKRLVLLDTHALIHRAFHALPPSLTSPAGEPVGAVYGFASILLRILKELKPDYIAAAFDLSGPTFRHVAYERYKAQRPETPSDLASQFEKVREMADAFGISLFQKEGYEADDIIGTIAKRLEAKKDIEIIVVTGDMDALQLVRPRLKVYTMKKGINETAIYDAKAVKDRYGITPSQIIDYKGLKGDPSDNIPGVKGIGEKTAIELLKRFKTIDGIYRALKKGTKVISEPLAQKLNEQKEEAAFSRELATIHQNAPIAFKLSDLATRDWRTLPSVRSALEKFGFRSLVNRIANGDKPAPAKKQKSILQQSTLLDVNVSNEDSGIPIARTLTEIISRASGEIGLIMSAGTLYGVSKQDRAPFIISDEALKAGGARVLSEKINLRVYDAKSLIRFFRARGVETNGISFDLLLAAYVVDASQRDFSYRAIAERELMVPLSEREALMRFFDVAEFLNRKLNDGKLRAVFVDIEMPLVPVLARIEEQGILIDTKFLGTLAKKVDARLERLTGEIHELAGEEFNINSSQQLSRILFDVLAISVVGLRKTEKGGVISTGASELEKLKQAHPIVEKILEYRELAKLKTTYIDVLPKLIDPRTGRIFTTLHQTGTATGRLSSSDPNLQNIPILSELGREIRKAFIASPGFLLASFDYSQIELRVAAHMANDEKMIEAFCKGTDIHQLTASEVYGVALHKVTPDLRRAAKTLNFGVLYGMGSQAFAESTGMPRAEAKKFIDEYFREFAGIRRYIESVKEFAEANGYVETLFGRRRPIPEIHTSNWHARREAERMAVNAPIQGTATGDIVKMAMVKVDEWIRREKVSDKVRMLLQVHDELLFELKKEDAEALAPRIKVIMEEVVKLKVPLAVDVHLGITWGKS